MPVKLFVGALTLMAIAGLSVAAFDKAPGKNRQEAQLETPGTTRTLQLPAPAANSKVISLGSAVDPQTGLTVEGLAIVNPKRAAAKPDRCQPWPSCKNDTGGEDPTDPPQDDGSGCWEPLAKGAVWKTVEPWLVEPTNSAGLDESYVFNRLVGDVDKWEDATDGVMDSAVAADIFGEATLSAGLLADSEAPDGLNEVHFGSIDQPGVIAVTIVWGVFGGPPKNRQLVEWDMVFDQQDFAWSDSGAAGAMDFENIATHELGHSVGLGHPNESCLEETMYAYASLGETKKRDLNSGDIFGTDSLY